MAVERGTLSAKRNPRGVTASSALCSSLAAHGSTAVKGFWARKLVGSLERSSNSLSEYTSESVGMARVKI